MKRTKTQKAVTPMPSNRGQLNVWKPKFKTFAQNEDGAMYVLGFIIFGLLLAIGGLSLDIMRYEASRERLQSTLDRAVLAAAALTEGGTDAEIIAHSKATVINHLATVGLDGAIDPADIDVQPGFGSKRVEAVARVHVPLHHGTFLAFGLDDDGGQTLIAEATSVAEESIGNVEISLVLDVSGSMDWYNRLDDLKDAAHDFLETVYSNSAPGKVSTSIIPYATQVNAGSEVLSYFNRNSPHEHSHCLNFDGSDFETTSVSLTDYYDQTLHFDPWTDEYDGFEVGNTPPYPVCGNEAALVQGREMMVWSTNKGDLQTYIANLEADGSTSTDIGVKWGAALLDPSMQPVLTGMTNSGSVDNALDGRPFNYETSDALKVLVVMTDGEHTSQSYMDDFRDGDSFVWRYENGDDSHYYVWHDGDDSEPDLNAGSSTQCTRWRWWGCARWETVYYWYEAYNLDNNGSGYSNRTRYRWTEAPHANAVRLTWTELFADLPPEFFSDDILANMGTLSSYDRNKYEYAISYVGSSTKDNRFADICQAADDQGVKIFSIGFSVNSSTHESLLQSCASAPGNYYDVDNLDIDFAFQSIAAQINQLRLVQ